MTATTQLIFVQNSREPAHNALEFMAEGIRKYMANKGHNADFAAVRAQKLQCVVEYINQLECAIIAIEADRKEAFNKGYAAGRKHEATRIEQPGIYQQPKLIGSVAQELLQSIMAQRAANRK